MLNILNMYSSFAKDLRHSSVISDVTFDSLRRWNHKLVINPEVTNYCVSLHHCRSQERKWFGHIWYLLPRNIVQSSLLGLQDASRLWSWLSHCRFSPVFVYRSISNQPWFLQLHLLFLAIYLPSSLKRVFQFITISWTACFGCFLFTSHKVYMLTCHL